MKRWALSLCPWADSPFFNTKLALSAWGWPCQSNALPGSPQVEFLLLSLIFSMILTVSFKMHLTVLSSAPTFIVCSDVWFDFLSCLLVTRRGSFLTISCLLNVWQTQAGTSPLVNGVLFLGSPALSAGSLHKGQVSPRPRQSGRAPIALHGQDYYYGQLATNLVTLEASTWALRKTSFMLLYLLPRWC